LTTYYTDITCALGTENEIDTQAAGLCSTDYSYYYYNLQGTNAKYYKTAVCSAGAAAPTLSPSVQLFPADAVAITGTNKYLYTNSYSDMSCTKPISGEAYPLNVCKPYILDGNRQYRMVTAAYYNRNTTSFVYYNIQYFDDSACTLYSPGYPYITSTSTMTGVTGTCQPGCKLYGSSTMAGVTTSLSSVMPSSGQLIPAGFTAVSTSGYLQQIAYKDSACTNVIYSFGTQLNTCFNLFGDLFAMYTAGSKSSANITSLMFGLYVDDTCTQMVYFTYPYNGVDHYLSNTLMGSACTSTNDFRIGRSQKMIISTSAPSFPSTGAVVK
jgi:hypothetical protein